MVGRNTNPSASGGPDEDRAKASTHRSQDERSTPLECVTRCSPGQSFELLGIQSRRLALFRPHRERDPDASIDINDQLHHPIGKYP